MRPVFCRILCSISLETITIVCISRETMSSTQRCESAIMNVREWDISGFIRDSRWIPGLWLYRRCRRGSPWQGRGRGQRPSFQPPTFMTLKKPIMKNISVHCVSSSVSTHDSPRVSIQFAARFVIPNWRKIPARFVVRSLRGS